MEGSCSLVENDPFSMCYLREIAVEGDDALGTIENFIKNFSTPASECKYQMFVWSGSRKSINFITTAHDFNHASRLNTAAKVVFGRQISTADILDMQHMMRCIDRERYRDRNERSYSVAPMVIAPAALCSGHRFETFFVQNDWHVSPENGTFRCMHGR